MSYDLFLFAPPPTDDPLAFARAAFEGEVPAEDAPPDWRDRMRATADALAAAEPALQAQAHGEEPGDAWIELAPPDDDSGLQIVVFHDTAFLHLAYGHTGAEVRAAWEQAWRCLVQMERANGWRTYDPQRERLLDLQTDLDAVVREYERAGATFLEALPTLSPPAPARRPWWKFWG
ncbi:hypothetical protein [Longimicrobium sp.]|uniref:hypothetical protein n=1 Tax=Longimicrobium sp. TaxID=2029185 RepID=UPI002E374BAA|nr:hypothetical protein [Longimicrobium sp.]HEX6040248.1 hypothetical protein [Longimicrobium sp.]